MCLNSPRQITTYTALGCNIYTDLDGFGGSIKLQKTKKKKRPPWLPNPSLKQFDNGNRFNNRIKSRLLCLQACQSFYCQIGPYF